MVAFLLGAIKSEAFFTLISGLIIAIVVFVLYNSSWVIRKKTKAEAIQKLKLDSMIEVINGTEELKIATTEVGDIVVNITRKLITSIITKVNMPEIELVDLFLESELKFKEDAKKSMGIITKYTLSLKKDMIINGEDEAIRRELTTIMNVHYEMMFSIINLYQHGLLSVEKDKSLSKAMGYYGTMDIDTKIAVAIENILKLYTERLNKESKNLLSKIVNCFRKDKKITLQEFKNRGIHDVSVEV